MSYSLRPLVEIEVNEEDPELSAEEPTDRRSRQVAAGGILLALSMGMCVWMAGRAGTSQHPDTVNGPHLDAVGLEGSRTQDEIIPFLDLGPASVCRGDNVDSHLGPTGNEGKVYTDKKSIPDGVDHDKCRNLCAMEQRCKGYELGPTSEKRCELWMGLTHHEDLFEHNTIYNALKAKKMHEIHPALAEYHCVLKVSHPSFNSLDQGCQAMVARHTKILKERGENFTKSCEGENTGKGHPLRCTTTRKKKIFEAINRLSQVCIEEIEEPMGEAAHRPDEHKKKEASGESAPVAEKVKNEKEPESVDGEHKNAKTERKGGPVKNEKEPESVDGEHKNAKTERKGGPVDEGGSLGGAPTVHSEKKPVGGDTTDKKGSADGESEGGHEKKSAGGHKKPEPEVELLAGKHLEPKEAKDPQKPKAAPAGPSVNWGLIALILVAVCVIGLAAASQHPAVKAMIFGSAAGGGFPNLMGSKPPGKGPREAGQPGYNPVENTPPEGGA